MEARNAGCTLTEVGKAHDLSPERVRQIECCAIDKLRRGKGQIALACIRDLVKRRGYRKPFRAPLPFKSVKYPSHIYGETEREAFAANRQEFSRAAVTVTGGGKSRNSDMRFRPSGQTKLWRYHVGGANDPSTAS